MYNVTLPEDFCRQMSELAPGITFLVIAIFVLVLVVCYGLITQVSLHMCRGRANEERQDRMDETIGQTRIRAHFPTAP